MTRQSEIREGVALRLFKICNGLLDFDDEEWEFVPENIKQHFRAETAALFQYLYSQGVVLQVEREEVMRLDERKKIQRWIDTNDVYKVIWEHYDDCGNWIPLRTERINITGGKDDN